MPFNPKVVERLRKIIVSFDRALTANQSKRNQLAELPQTKETKAGVAAFDEILDTIASQRVLLVKRLQRELDKEH